MNRPGLVLTAVVTVTVPGLLAMMAVLGHEHVAAQAHSPAVALDGSPLSGPSPVPSATASAAAHTDVVGRQSAPGGPRTALSATSVRQRVLGMHLLDRAANASLATSYKGTELVSQSGVDGSVKMISQVWHKGGGPTLVETSDGTTSAAAQPAAAKSAGAKSAGAKSAAAKSAAAKPAAAKSAGAAVATSDPASGSPEGVFGLTKRLVALLGEHYIAVYWGRGSVVHRPTSVVELYRSNGSMAARYWLDSRTLVPLRRELFGTSDNVISEDSFVQIQFGKFIVPHIAATGAAPPQSPQKGRPSQQTKPSAWVAAPSPAKFLTALTRRGWRVPAVLPGGLPLYEAASTKTRSGEIIDLEYTDGLYVVSLFMQRGTLAPRMPGWQPVSVAGQHAYVSGHSVTWAGPGVVYTVIADVPPQTVTQIVKAMPSGGSPGILDRLGRGFVRLASAMNPFG